VSQLILPFLLAVTWQSAPSTIAVPASSSSPSNRDANAALVDVVINLQAPDGTPLEAKLSLPATGGAATSRPFPVVFYLHGAGPRTYENSFRYADADGAVKVASYLDYHAVELGKRGIAFFRMSKRGCKTTAAPPFIAIDREVFSKATLSVLVDDYAAALQVLRARQEIDPSRIVLLGGSEGTRAGPLLAKRSPEGIAAVAMMGYAADNARKTVEWQNTVGPWRNMMYLIPAARDGELTQAEHEDFARVEPGRAKSLPFAALDTNGDGKFVSEELERLNQPRFEAILKAVREKDDDFLWKNLLNLSSRYLEEWWDAPANAENLLALQMPLAIFHGTLDAACRVEGVRETEAAFKQAGRTQLTVKLYENSNHDLDWTWRTMVDGGPPAYRDAFDWIRERVR
jgi:pimeloyl-ACP methyl ester carboxylesterase